jgi:hypothetical protein
MEKTMKPHKTPTAILILFALGFVFLNLSGSISAVQAQVQVTAADPMSAAQGTVNLNVKVTGKGFKKGAAAKFLVSGTTDTGGVQVNSTTFVNSGELTANVDVADTAVIANFDIAVTNADGRGGKGTELFAVTSNGSSRSTSCTVQPLPAGISLVATFNYLGPLGGAHYGPALGTTVRARQMILNGAPVLVVGVSSSPSIDPKLEIFFVDPVSGQVLDGTNIGSATTAQPHVTVSGPGGRSLAVGDVNGDGIPDFVAGTGANAVVGSINGSGVVSYQNYVLTMPASATGAGWGVAMGDLNDTGSDVIAIGAIGGGNGSAALGEVSLFSWNGSGFTNTQNINSPLPNPRKDENFGKGVAIADVTGTGAKDLIVGAPTSIVNGVTGAGRVFVFPGPVSASIYLTFTTGLKGDNFGNKVASGDVNGDFLGDLLATTWNGDTKAQVYDGLVSQGESPNFVLRPISGLSLGWSTDEPDMNDVNGDGLADVLIGAPNAASGSICGGAAYLYLSGGVGFPLATRLMLNTPVVETSSSPFQVFGWATAFAPGTRLFFVSDHGLDLGSTTNAGQVYVYKMN